MTKNKRIKLMKMQKEIIVTVSAILLIILVSCKENRSSEKEIVIQNKFKNGYVEFNFDFPDTIYINEVYNGKINYKSVLDTITTSFEDKRKSRYITYYMNKTQDVNYNLKDLKKMNLDTFGAINNRTIPIYGIKFSELGVHYLDGIINDHISIDTFSQSKKNEDKARYIENVVRATHKVIVIEKSK